MLFFGPFKTSPHCMNDQDNEIWRSNDKKNMKSWLNYEESVIAFPGIDFTPPPVNTKNKQTKVKNDEPKVQSKPMETENHPKKEEPKKFQPKPVETNNTKKRPCDTSEEPMMKDLSENEPTAPKRTSSRKPYLGYLNVSMRMTLVRLL